MHENDPIGPSTLISGLSGAQALTSTVHQILENDFNAIEICPAQFQRVNPLDTPQYLTSIYPTKERQQLKKTLTPFRYVSVHGSSFWVTRLKASTDLSHIELPYRELMRFASDINADVVSFHPIQSASEDYSKEALIQINIDFGKRAATYAKQQNLHAAFENMPGTTTWMTLSTITHIVNEINNPHFGLLFDIGHAMLERDEPNTVRNHRLLTQLTDHASQTIQYHFHGLYQSPQGYKDHGPLHLNNVINHHSINEYRQLSQNHTPIIFEIYHNPIINVRASFEQNLVACLTAKSQLTTS
jgi:sugar phosphate isomerase/epimerase